MKRKPRQAPRIGMVETITCEIVQCHGCDDLRYRELACLPCDLPAPFVAEHSGTWACVCFDYPEEIAV